MVEEFLSAISEAHSNAGALAGLGAGLMASLRIYKDPAVQSVLPKKARWDSLPGWLKAALPFLLSLGGASLTAVAGGVPILSSLVQALPVALSAIGLDFGTKALGQAEHALKGKPYVASKLRQKASIVVPLPPEVKSSFIRPE